MNVNGLSFKDIDKNSAFGNIANGKQKSVFSSDKDQFATQIENLKKQIQTVSESDGYDEKTKMEKVAELNEKIKEVEKQKKEAELLKLQEEQKKQRENLQKKNDENDTVTTNVDGDILSVSKFLINTQKSMEQINEQNVSKAKAESLISLKERFLKNDETVNASNLDKLDPKNLNAQQRDDLKMGLIDAPGQKDLTNKKKDLDNLHQTVFNYKQNVTEIMSSIKEDTEELIKDVNKKPKEDEVTSTNDIAPEKTDATNPEPVKVAEEVPVAKEEVFLHMPRMNEEIE